LNIWIFFRRLKPSVQSISQKLEPTALVVGARTSKEPSRWSKNFNGTNGF